MQGKNNVINSKKNIDDRPDEYDVEKVWRCHSRIVPNGWQERKRRRPRRTPTNAPRFLICIFIYSEHETL